MLRLQTAEIATFSRLQERVINVRWCCFCARLFWLGHCRTPRGADGRLASRRVGPSPLGWCSCCSCSSRYRCYLVLIVVIWWRSSSCVFVSLFNGVIFIAEIQICGLSYFKRLHFCILVSASHSSSRNPTHPPVFIAPRDFRSRKMWFLCQNSHFSVIFVGFLPITKSIMNRFSKRFSFSDSPCTALQQCCLKFVATQTS